MFDGALREASNGVLIDMDVRPGAAATRITGYNEWRHALTADVAAPPERGAANRALEALLARLGGAGAVARVVRGAASRHKTVRVHGVSRRSLAAALAEAVR